jgi:hypothetical protein
MILEVQVTVYYMASNCTINVVMNLLVLLAERLLASKEGLFSI